MSGSPRLLEILYSFESGGSERVGAIVAEGLAARGWTVTVAATHSAGGPIREALQAFGLPCHGLDIENHGRLARRWAVYRLCRRLRPEVLHAQHIPMLMLCFWPAWLAGVRHFVVTEHTDQQLLGEPDVRNWLRRYARRLSRITVIHEGLARYLVDEIGIPADRVRVIVNGVDSERFRPTPPDSAVRHRLGLADNRVLVGCVARLHPDKDHATLVRAFADMLRANGEPAAHLVVIGEGETRAEIESLVRTLGIAENVTLLGDRADIEKLMPQFDVLALASRTEGLPMVLLEAMACGVPCVATAVGGVPALLADAGGELVEPGDVSAMSAALGRLCTDGALRRRLGAAARECILAGYRQMDMIDGYRDELAPRGSDEVAGVVLDG